MNYKQIDLEDIKNFSLSENTNIEHYLLYRKLFTEYIIEKLNLKKYDDEVSNNNLNFIPIEEAKMDIYQYFSSDILKYFYIRNNLYIEKLDKDTIYFLAEKIKNQDYILDEKSRDIIENTYRNILFKNTLEGFKCFAFYGPQTTSFSAEDDAIVIGFRYDEFNLNGKDDNEWNENFEKQQLWLFQFLEKLKYEFEETLNNNVSIIKYNEYSVIPRT